MNRFQSVTFIIALVICATNPPASMANQGNFAATGIGGRSSVFDEAFVAVADDPGVLYWNPAGISKLRNRYNLIFSHTRPFSNVFDSWAIQQNFQSFVFSNKSWGVGASLDMLRTDKIVESDEFGGIISTDFKYSEYKASASVGKELWRRVSVGATFNYYEIQDINDVGLDIGVLIPNNRNFFRIGAVVRNISTLDEMPSRYSVGFALQLAKVFQWAGAYSTSDKVSKFASAVELYWDWNKIALKLYSGLEYYSYTSDNFVWKFGGTINLGNPLLPSSNLGLNYSFEKHRFLQYSHRVTLSFGYQTNVLGLSIGFAEIKKLEKGVKKKAKGAYQSTDKIIVLVDIPGGIQADDLKREPVVLKITDPDGYPLFKQRIKEPAHPLQYDFIPTRDWLPNRGFLKTGPYTVNIDTEEWNYLNYFYLDYNKDVQTLVDKAYDGVVDRNLEKAEQFLVNAVELDPSYPTTYYVAGLAAEFSGDFVGAKLCYDKAAKLNNYDKLEYKDVEINLQEIVNLLDSLIKKFPEAQESCQSGIYEKLK